MYHVFSFLPIASLTHAGLQKKRVVHSLTLNWITMGLVRLQLAAVVCARIALFLPSFSK